MNTTRTRLAPLLAALPLLGLPTAAILGASASESPSLQPNGARATGTVSAAPIGGTAAAARGSGPESVAGSPQEPEAAPQDPVAPKYEPVDHAIVILRRASGSEASGTVRIDRVEDGLRIHGSVSGLEPGRHGFHIHTFGDLRAIDGTSTGGHYAPRGHEHGARRGEERHVGDLGNIVAGDDGVAVFDMVDETVVLEGPYSILGRAFVVHGGADTFEGTSGEAGHRVAAGVVGIANPDRVPEEDRYVR